MSDEEEIHLKQFLRKKDNEDQQLLGKCVFPCLFFSGLFTCSQKLFTVHRR